MLPHGFLPFAGSAALDVAATMLPARNVGGDFYDYFQLDADRIGFVIGDVSGKGVPAALFMAMSRTVLKAVLCSGRPRRMPARSQCFPVRGKPCGAFRHGVLWHPEFPHG